MVTRYELEIVMKTMKKRLMLALVLLLGSLSGRAVIGGVIYDEDFSGNDGSYTVTNDGAIEGPWVYDGTDSWTVDGSTAVEAPTHSRLTSPTIAVSEDGLLWLNFAHRYSIEGDICRTNFHPIL